MLKITIHNHPWLQTLELEGKLAGPWVEELDRCWHDMLANQGEPALRIDLTGVTYVDAAGKACLANLLRRGVTFVAADCLMQSIVDELVLAQSPEPTEDRS